jgi:hypothetical protein
MIAAGRKAKCVQRKICRAERSLFVGKFTAQGREIAVGGATIAACGVGITVGGATIAACSVGITVGGATITACGGGITVGGAISLFRVEKSTLAK